MQREMRGTAWEITWSAPFQAIRTATGADTRVQAHPSVDTLLRLATVAEAWAMPLSRASLTDVANCLRLAKVGFALCQLPLKRMLGGS